LKVGEKGMKVKGGEKRKGWEKEGMFRGEIMVEVGKGRNC
jgi:hypothetical protein